MNANFSGISTNYFELALFNNFEYSIQLKYKVMSCRLLHRAFISQFNYKVIPFLSILFNASGDK